MIERRPSRRHPLDAGFLTTRLGRIQRIGQVRSEVDVYNLRYANSVEDRVRELLSARQENIFRLFGQLPDTLEDVWVEVALGRIEEAKRTIDAVPERHPFPPRSGEWTGSRAPVSSPTTRNTRRLLAGGTGVDPGPWWRDGAGAGT